MRIVRQFFRALKELAYELSDERAYERHLKGSGCAHSKQQWQKFYDARLMRKYRQGKCC
jgi:hypothetical protein